MLTLLRLVQISECMGNCKYLICYPVLLYAYAYIFGGVELVVVTSFVLLSTKVCAFKIRINFTGWAINTDWEVTHKILLIGNLYEKQKIILKFHEIYSSWTWLELIPLLPNTSPIRITLFLTKFLGYFNNSTVFWCHKSVSFYKTLVNIFLVVSGILGALCNVDTLN